MAALVTIGIPVYRCLDYLPQTLESVRAQDYDNIEVIVSDNGINGPRLEEIVNRYYRKPFRLRKNPATVSPVAHFNQIIHEASGEYFMMLHDDDLVSPNYVSELESLLASNSNVSVAISRQESMDKAGHFIRGSVENIPEMISGRDFLREWSYYTYRFICHTSILARTSQLKMCGGYPDFPTGNSSDDALLIKLCLNNHVAYSPRCLFRKREFESSLGYGCSYTELVKAETQFLQFLDADPWILEQARIRPADWSETKKHIIRLIWETCFSRWRYMYRKRLPRMQWVLSAFAMPFIPDYYSAVIHTLVEMALSRVKALLPRQGRPTAEL